MNHSWKIKTSPARIMSPLSQYSVPFSIAKSWTEFLNLDLLMISLGIDRLYRMITYKCALICSFLLKNHFQSTLHKIKCHTFNYKNFSEGLLRTRLQKIGCNDEKVLYAIKELLLECGIRTVSSLCFVLISPF